jgi:hypothetical protein
MPNKNQKKMSDYEKEKLREGAERKKKQDEMDLLDIKEAEKQLFEKEKANLPTLLETRLNEIETAIAKEVEDIKGLPAPRIHQLIARKTIGSIGYSAKELAILLKAFEEMVVKINQHTIFVPSISHFCAFAGFSSATYKSYLNSTDEEKREVMTMIDDYIRGMLLDSSKMRRTDPATSIFVAKAEHQMAEASNPQVITFQNAPNIERIMEKVREINKDKVVEAEFKEK